MAFRSRIDSGVLRLITPVLSHRVWESKGSDMYSIPTNGHNDGNTVRNARSAARSAPTPLGGSPGG